MQEKWGSTDTEDGLSASVGVLSRLNSDECDHENRADELCTWGHHVQHHLSVQFWFIDKLFGLFQVTGLKYNITRELKYFYISIFTYLAYIELVKGR